MVAHTWLYLESTCSLDVIQMRSLLLNYCLTAGCFVLHPGMNPDCGRRTSWMEVAHTRLKSAWKQNSRSAPRDTLSPSVTSSLIANSAPGRSINRSAWLTTAERSRSSLRQTLMTSVRWSARPTTPPLASTRPVTSKTPWRARCEAWFPRSPTGDVLNIQCSGMTNQSDRIFFLLPFGSLHPSKRGNDILNCPQWTTVTTFLSDQKQTFDNNENFNQLFT